MKLNEFHNDIVYVWNSYKINTSDSTKLIIHNLLNKYPNNVNLLLLLARVNYDLYQDDSSIYYYNSVVTSDSNNIYALNGLSSLYSIKKNKDSAFYYLNKSLNVNDTFPFTIISKALINMYFSESLDTASLINLKLSKADSTESIYLRLSYIFNKINKKELSTQYLNLLYNKGFKDSSSVDLLINQKMNMDSFFRLYKL